MADQLWLKDDKLVMVDGKLVLCADCPCGPPPTPCVCPGGLSTTYLVSGWDTLGTGLCGTACIAEGDCTGTNFTGVLTLLVPCEWVCASSTCLNGMLSTIYVILNNTSATCFWQLYFECNVGISGCTYWYGWKSTGLTPAGTYALANTAGAPDPLGQYAPGAAGPATLTVA